MGEVNAQSSLEFWGVKTTFIHLINSYTRPSCVPDTVLSPGKTVG